MMEAYWTVSCICITVVIIFLIVSFWVRMILGHKKKIVEMNLSHEEKMKGEEWVRKIIWENRISEGINAQNNLMNEVAKQKECLAEKDKEITKLKEQLKSATQLDIERITLLVNSFADGRWLTSEKSAKLVEQVKSTQEAIKKYLGIKS